MPRAPLRAGVLQRCGERSCPPGTCDHGRRSPAAAAPTAARVPAIVDEVLQSPGRPLDDGTRAEMNAAFGFDFSRVRVHADTRASESARAVGALAYTVGSQIVFRSGHAPAGQGMAAGSPRDAPAAGRRLLAHELAHVVQQRDLPAVAAPLTAGPPGGGHERQADAAAETVASGGPAPPLSPLWEPSVQRQGMGEARVAGEAFEEAEAARVMGRRQEADALLTEVDRILAGQEYEADAGETIQGIAKRFGTTVAALQRANDLPSWEIKPGQRLKVPALAAGCALVPASAEDQMLAGAIFAEASPKAEANDEREAIGWSFVNSARHVQRLCNREICQHLRDAQRSFQCGEDTKYLGATVADSIRIGSVAVRDPRWPLVMRDDRMLPPANLCLLPPAEWAPLAAAIATAETVLSGGAPPKEGYIRFNKAADDPPNPDRMELAGRHEVHTFYRFKPGAECGLWK